ncbi:hypothetical protein D8B20_11275 [Candidatus Pantoea soli]|uniref:Uncharacterized protein n=1 Tax=Candidatus Pantoea soli TaxID=3098669 RepID=A0A518XE02_9GAMM|nr:hypothetical protein D8B20_11275 [Pantoea soli]
MSGSCFHRALSYAFSAKRASDHIQTQRVAQGRAENKAMCATAGGRNGAGASGQAVNRTKKNPRCAG